MPHITIYILIALIAVLWVFAGVTYFRLMLLESATDEDRFMWERTDLRKDALAARTTAYIVFLAFWPIIATIASVHARLR